MSSDYKQTFKECVIEMNEVTHVGGKPLMYIYASKWDGIVILSHEEMLLLQQDLKDCLHE